MSVKATAVSREITETVTLEVQLKYLRDQNIHIARVSALTFN